MEGTVSILLAKLIFNLKLDSENRIIGTKAP